MLNSKQIITERLILEPFSEKYLTERYVSWLNDTNLMKFSENRHRTHTLESCREYLESFNGSDHSFWAIVEESTGEHIGNTNAYIDTFNSIADVGILIGEKQGNGFGYEAWQAVIDFLFNHIKVRKITAGTMAVNKGMIKIMQRCGMIDDGVRKRQFILDTKEVDAVYMAIFNRKYKS